MLVTQFGGPSGVRGRHVTMAQGETLWHSDAFETIGVVIYGQVQAQPDGGGAATYGPGDLITVPQGIGMSLSAVIDCYIAVLP